jgi:menaquinol-cytochrome c reductase iron-sulfur subunit
METPADGTAPEEPSRRSLLAIFSVLLSSVIGTLLGVPLVGSFLGPLLARRKPPWVRLGPLPKDLSKPARFTYRYVRVDGWLEKTVYGTAYAVRAGEELVVLSNVCTHLGCGVRWDDAQRAFLCPCHNGRFDQSGKPTFGPPAKPLLRFEHRVRQDTIEIRVEEA